MTAPFISSEDLAAYTKIDTLDSLLAQIALDAACETVRGFCDQGLDEATSTDAWLDGTGSATIRLPRFPVSALTALAVSVDRADAAPETLTENTDFVLNTETGVLTRIDGGVFYESPQSVKVSYTHGYSTVPSDARLVALQVAARIYELGMVENESVGGISATYVAGAGQLTDAEKDALYRYRRSS